MNYSMHMVQLDRHLSLPRTSNNAHPKRAAVFYTHCRLCAAAAMLIQYSGPSCLCLAGSQYPHHHVTRDKISLPPLPLSLPFWHPRSFLAVRVPALCGTLTATSSPTATSWRRPRRSPSRCLTAPTPRQRACSVLMPATVLNALFLNSAVEALRSSAVTVLEQGC